jgi:hypothetical protein
MGQDELRLQSQAQPLMSSPKILDRASSEQSRPLERLENIDNVEKVNLRAAAAAISTAPTGAQH